MPVKLQNEVEIWQVNFSRGVTLENWENIYDFIWEEQRCEYKTDCYSPLRRRKCYTYDWETTHIDSEIENLCTVSYS